jgi:hypothetical protein
MPFRTRELRSSKVLDDVLNHYKVCFSQWFGGSLGSLSVAT